MIRTQIIGHLGQSATINNVNGQSVINFSVAHAESYKNKEGVKVDNTVWIGCSFFTEKTAVANTILNSQLSLSSHIFNNHQVM